MDGPKHLPCLEDGLAGQFYRIAGSSNYKCKSCGLIQHATEFEEIEFRWKTEPDKWKAWREKKARERDKKREPVKK